MKLKATDIARMASASDVVFEALREAISSGDIGEGETLRQDHIARLFNVSRIPVREALTRLEEQGLVVTRRYKGAVVSTLSVEEIREIFEFRALLEPEVLRQAVPLMNAQVLEAAARCAEAFADEADSARWGELNRAFHSSLYEASGRGYFLQAISAAFDRVERYTRAQLALTDGMERARREHAAILAACVAGDGEAAAGLTREHILGAAQSLIAFLEKTRADAARG